MDKNLKDPYHLVRMMTSKNVYFHGQLSLNQKSSFGWSLGNIRNFYFKKLCARGQNDICMGMACLDMLEPTKDPKWRLGLFKCNTAIQYL